MATAFIVLAVTAEVPSDHDEHDITAYVRWRFDLIDDPPVDVSGIRVTDVREVRA